MPNKPVHLAAGLVTGAAIAVGRLQYVEGQDLFSGEASLGQVSVLTILLISAAVGGQFGLMPDILEPAKNGNWKHRKFFHSYAVMALLVFFTYKMESNTGIDDLFRHFFTVAAAGYISHLLLDSRTPAGLPWI